ncbi:MAG: EamA family transporter [Deltaproteobacteria bacterium]|nr:EamA family transporter [Deltaproteobacteria bacterium]
MTPFVLGIVLTSALMHALWNAYAKDSESPIAYLALVHGVTVVAGLPLLALFDLREVPISVWGALAAAGVVHTCYMSWLALAYERGEMSVVYPIARSTPAFLPLIAVPVMGDPVSLTGAVGIAITVAGLWIVQTEGRFGLAALRAPGAGFAYLTLIATVGYSLIDKQAMLFFNEAEWTGPLPRSVAYYFLLCLPITAVFTPFALRRVPRGAWGRVWRAQWGRVIGGAVAGFLSYGLVLEALRTASVSYVTAVRQTSVIFAAGLAAFMLHERPTRLRMLGSLATVAGVVLIVLYA